MMKKCLLMVIAGIMMLNCAVGAVSMEEEQKIAAAMPDKPIVKPKQERSILVFSLCKGFAHSSIPYWQKALEVMAQKTGAFKARFSDDMTVFTEDNLKQYDVVCFNNTTQLEFDDAQKAALMNFVKGGKGIVGIHAATDNFYHFPEAAQMMGGQFAGHPWVSGGTWAIKIDQPEHPLVKMFGGKGFKVSDEIYRTPAPLYGRDKQLVLMSLDMSDPATRDAPVKARDQKPGDSDTGISWVKMWGKGRVFYCSLGHNHPLTWTPEVLQHYLAGIQFALGDYDVPTTVADKETAISAGLGAAMADIVTYDFGKDRTSLAKFEDAVASSSGNVQARRDLEQFCMSGLQHASATYAAKDFLCRQLSLIGSDASIPTLEKMVKDPVTSDIARFALERISGQVSEQALLNVLASDVDAAIKTGIVYSLGARKTALAVKPLAALMSDSNTQLAAAAVSSLGRIGTVEAAGLLQEAYGKAASAQKSAFQNAMIDCAGQLGVQGRSLYTALISEGTPSLVRAAAFRGLAACEGGAPEKVIATMLKEKDPAVVAAALGLMSQVKDAGALEVLLKSCEGLNDDQQIRLLYALRLSGNPAGKAYVGRALAGKSQSVQQAALYASEILCDADNVMVIAQIAAADSSIQSAARNTLETMNAPGVNEAIIEKLSKRPSTDQEKGICRELIRTCGQRQMHTAMAVLLVYARHEEARLRQEAIRSLGMVAEPADLPELVKLLVEQPDTGVQNLVASVAIKNSNRKGRAKLLTEQWETNKDAKCRIAILGVMGRIGDPETVDLLRKTSTAQDTELAQAAFRAMCDWPGSELLDEMVTFAKSDNQRQSALAMRAAVRMTVSAEAKSPSEKTAMLKVLMSSCKRVEDKKLVLGGLGSCPCPESILLAAESLASADLAAEAEAAVLTAAGGMKTSLPEDIKTIVRKIADQTTSTQNMRMARTLLRSN